ncbi:MAG: hypothetical protein J0H78_06570 [Rhizobiales bacterium]|nr:hypothetical protein [Hyphomicrobiales bacterium]OJY41641.1 MAG: hypothetical protein BGP08_09610 [Rhizobiales bacterium 64-17]
MRPRCPIRFAIDTRGSIAVLAAVMMAVVMAIAALAIDTGKVFADRRRAQGATDLAAIAAVSDLGNAARAATATIARNQFSGVTPRVELGIYLADAAVPPAQRFKPGAAGTANAARVTLQSLSTLAFGAALLGRDTVAITTQAVAAQSAFATFAIGSRLVSLDGGVLNALLSSLLGTSVSLSVMDYQALLDTRVDLFDTMSALATRLNVTGGSYTSLLATSTSSRNVIAALTDAARLMNASSRAVSALTGIGQALPTDAVSIAALIDPGVYGTLKPGEKPRVSATASALDILTAMAQIASARRQADIALNLGIPGIVSASLSVLIGERPQGTSWITVGAAGAQVSTAQARVLLRAQVLGGGSIASVTLPIIITLAPAKAVLGALTCGYPDRATSTARLDVTPGVVDAWIGTVSTASFADFTNPVTAAPATLLDVLGLVKATARAHAAVTNMTATPVSFSMGEIAAQTRKTVGTTDFTRSLLSSLLANTQLSVSLLGINALLPDTTTPLLRTILANAAAPLDQLLVRVLGTLGISLGQADVWITGLRCDGAVLVN